MRPRSESGYGAEATSRRIRLVTVFHHGVSQFERALDAALVAAAVAQKQSSLHVSIFAILNGLSAHAAKAAALIHERQSGGRSIALHAIRNEVRDQRSSGFLSRDWNAALILAFGSLRPPHSCDIAVLMQHDAVLRPRFFTSVLKLHKSSHVDFAVYGRGDEVHSYTPEAVRRVGMWDERFSAIGMAEGDYFMRAVLALGPKAMVSDRMHGRLYRPLDSATLHRDFLNLHASIGAQRAKRGQREHTAEEAAEYSNATRFYGRLAHIWDAKWAPLKPLGGGSCYDLCLGNYKRNRHEDELVSSLENPLCNRSCDERVPNPVWCRLDENVTAGGACEPTAGRCCVKPVTDGSGLGRWARHHRDWTARIRPRPRLPPLCLYPHFDVMGCASSKV